MMGQRSASFAGDHAERTAGHVTQVTEQYVTDVVRTVNSLCMALRCNLSRLTPCRVQPHRQRSAINSGWSRARLERCLSNTAQPSEQRGEPWHLVITSIWSDLTRRELVSHHETSTHTIYCSDQHKQNFTVSLRYSSCQRSDLRKR